MFLYYKRHKRRHSTSRLNMVDDADELTLNSDTTRSTAADTESASTIASVTAVITNSSSDNSSNDSSDNTINGEAVEDKNHSNDDSTITYVERSNDTITLNHELDKYHPSYQDYVRKMYISKCSSFPYLIYASSRASSLTKAWLYSQFAASNSVTNIVMFLSGSSAITVRSKLPSMPLLPIKSFIPLPLPLSPLLYQTPFSTSASIPTTNHSNKKLILDRYRFDRVPENLLHYFIYLLTSFMEQCYVDLVAGLAFAYHRQIDGSFIVCAYYPNVTDSDNNIDDKEIDDQKWYDWLNHRVASPDKVTRVPLNQALSLLRQIPWYLRLGISTTVDNSNTTASATIDSSNHTMVTVRHYCNYSFVCNQVETEAANFRATSMLAKVAWLRQYPNSFFDDDGNCYVSCAKITTGVLAEITTGVLAEITTGVLAEITTGVLAEITTGVVPCESSQLQQQVSSDNKDNLLSHNNDDNNNNVDVKDSDSLTSYELALSTIDRSKYVGEIETFSQTDIGELSDVELAGCIEDGGHIFSYLDLLVHGKNPLTRGQLSFTDDKLLSCSYLHGYNYDSSQLQLICSSNSILCYTPIGDGICLSDCFLPVTISDNVQPVDDELVAEISTVLTLLWSNGKLQNNQQPFRRDDPWQYLNPYIVNIFQQSWHYNHFGLLETLQRVYSLIW